MMVSRLAFVFLLATSAAAGISDEKRLHWRRLDVVAHLDGDGRLLVSERQTIVFNGEWNGGERKFNLRIGQTLQLRGIKRVDASGASRPLIEGDLDAVDEWQWHDSNTLRWRSRSASDPPFQNAEITYEIDYSIMDVLRSGEEEVYVLRHEFAFPQRDGIIEVATARLTVDGAWSPLVPLPPSLVWTGLAPGQSPVVEAAFRYLPNGHPAAVTRGVPAEVGWAIAVLLLLAVSSMCIRHFADERRAGVFEPLLPVEQINEAWLQENLFSFPPEVIGAAWDNETSAAEVAAVLARMTAEGKLITRVEKTSRWRANDLHLTLLVPRDHLKGYEATLIDALFFEGDETSTSMLREHYKKRGFDPAAKIRGPIEKMSRRLVGTSRGRKGNKAASWKVSGLLLSLGVALLLLTGFQPAQNVLAAAVGSGVALALLIFGIIGAFAYQTRVTHMKLSTLGFMIPIALLISAVCAFLVIGTSSVPLSAITLAGLATLAAAVTRIVFQVAKVPNVGERFQLRRRLAAAREYFKSQLRNRHPALEDEWFPYLLAFGLGPRIDRWFQAFGTSSQSHDGSLASSASSGSTSTGHGWSGGGGSFGGAGASGSWAVAAGALGARVSAPGSSGGGGGGGGSSGGGGGGGW